MRPQVQKLKEWTEPLLLLPLAIFIAIAVVIIEHKGVFQELKAFILRRKYLNTRSGRDVDLGLRDIFKQAVKPFNFPPLENAILTAIRWEYCPFQANPDRMRNHLESIRCSVRKLSDVAFVHAELSFDDLMLVVCNKYAEKPISAQSNEQLSREEILALSVSPIDNLQARVHFSTWLKIVQAIVFHHQYPTPPVHSMQPVKEDSATPSMKMVVGKIGDLEQQFYCRLLFARTIRDLVLHAGLEKEDTQLLYNALSMFTQPGDKRLVRRYVSDIVDFDRIERIYLEPSLHSEIVPETVGYYYQITPDILMQAKRGDINAVIRLASFIVLANSK